MRLLIQRVKHASVVIDGSLKSKIGMGLLGFLGVEVDDTTDDVEWLVAKMCNLRIFDDKNGVMNLDVRQVDGEVMLVSQFTLCASTKKGNRPSYIKAAPESVSKPMYEQFITAVSRYIGREVATGEFGADMKIELLNDGPVTIYINTKNKE